MTRLKLFPLIFSLGLVVWLLPSAAAQEPGQIDARPAQNSRPRAERRPNLFAELGLSPEQVQQIRRINADRKPQMTEAQQKLRDANRALDAAIYADTANDIEIDARLKDYHSAQAEVARIRFISELSIRKVLTPEQLVRFREMRQRFADTRENRQRQRIERRSQRRKQRPAPSIPPQPVN